MMKKLGKGKGGMMKKAMQAMMGKGGMPGMGPGMDNMDPKQLEAAAKQLGGKMPGGLPGLGGGMALPPGLSGFGKKK